MKIDRGMVMACVLARLQAQNRKLADVPPDELQQEINSAIEDLRFAADVVEPK
jgi:hypothetical protein